VKRRALLLAVLVYVSLDLSMAEMPGAFVFEPASSVESAHGARTRGAEPPVAIPASPNPSTVSAATPHPLPPMSTAFAHVARACRVVSRLPRAAVVAPAAPEDAH
jgi:hypothetical protein